ncbi:MAG TPA: acetate/propionate family kinase [Polyangiaceae bacterium]|nr:acetate/propionate family kinase [Polyangiaceae bacterium]
MIAVFNAGSSSLKFGLYAADGTRAIAAGLVDWEADPERARVIVRRDGVATEAHREVASYRAAVACAVEALDCRAEDVAVVGQRIVLGGTKFSQSVLIDDDVKAEVANLAELAPLHNPPALESIEAVAAGWPGRPQVAVFDTSYYATLPPAEFVYPVPYEWYSDWGVRRFGFHGISHSYCASRAAEMLGRSALRVVSCHLGNGCSATASRDGTAVATTMGFTPLDGLVMGTRPGSLDPGILLHVQRRRGLSAAQLEHVLNHEAGLMGLSGVSSDYRLVEEAARNGNHRARLAIEIHAARVRSAIGALAVTLGGVEALVFTAGVGEHSAALREAACVGLECLGLKLDPAKNRAGQKDSDIASDDSIGRILVVSAQEEMTIAREALRVLQESGARV